MTKKTNSKKALGRGLEALIPLGIEKEIFSDLREGRINEIDIELIKPNAFQPRKIFDKTEIESLTESVKRNGVLQPILVRKIGENFEIIAGERRWRASKGAKLKTVPAIVLDLDEERRFEIALVENIQRTDLSPIEEALAYETLIDKYGITQQELGKRVGKSRTYITNSLRLLTLETNTKNALIDKEITVGHAKVLASLPLTKQKRLTTLIKTNGMSVRDLESLIRNEKKHKEKKEDYTRTLEKYVEVEQALSEHYGTKVSIKDASKRGFITLEFYDEDDFNRIYELLLT